MSLDERVKLRKRLKKQGFDETKSSPSGVRVGCSQCQAAVIQGMACHEPGCPNKKRR